MARFFENPERLERALQVSERAAKAYANENRNQASQSASLLTVRSCDTAAMAFVTAVANEIALRTLELTDALEKRIDELERKRVMSFEGAHDISKSYVPGSVVQRSGSVYVCLLATSHEMPGASPMWRRIGECK